MEGPNDPYEEQKNQIEQHKMDLELQKKNMEEQHLLWDRIQKDWNEHLASQEAMMKSLSTEYDAIKKELQDHHNEVSGLKQHPSARTNVL